ncbi:MAG: hypothetical protein Q9191_004758 [Dirinaria sp. TL-2023a]
METVTTRLLGTVRELDDHLESVDRTTSRGSVSKSSKRLIEISKACRMIAVDILDRLEAIKKRGPPSVWGSIRQAIKIMWTKEELDALMKRLKAYISELDTAILVSMKRDIDLQTLRASQNFHKLNLAAQNIVDLLILNRSVFTTALQDHTKEIKGVIISEQAQTRAMILDLVQHKGLGQATSASFLQSTGNNEPPVDVIHKTEARIARTLLDSLSFPAMQDRQDEVAHAYHSTFEWIFDEPRHETRNLPWNNFIHWLRDGRGIYWVNGKAGSGKSTLMKYIYNHKMTSEVLSLWSGTKPVLVATFFFWNSGTPEQRSQAGLLRSLLFQILQYQPKLIPSVFPDEHAFLQSPTVTDLSDLPRRWWALPRLQDALRRLVDIVDMPMNICLFIDGLDEFEGNEDGDDRQHMIQLLRSLNSSRFIKVCVSSRPLLLFEESFKKSPGLRLQDLTSGDIRRYVVDKLDTDPRIQENVKLDSFQKYDFVEEVCNKAQGVFLWVKLVVRSLLDGLSNDDQMTHLRARLGALPSDLIDLYHHMLGQVDKLYLSRTSQIFQMVQTMRSIQSERSFDNQRTTQVTLLLLALAVEEKPNVDVDSVSEVWLARNLSTLCDVMRRRLQTWCAGLLEVPDFVWNRVDALDAETTLRTKVTWEVAFLHRTARDFIESEVWSTMTEYTVTNPFDPCTSLLRSIILLYQLAGRLVSNPLGYGLFKSELVEPATHALLLAQRAQSLTTEAQVNLLNDLNVVMQRHLIRWTGPFDGQWFQYLDTTVPSDNFYSFADVAVFYGLHHYVRFWVLNAQARHPEDPDYIATFFKEDLSDPDRIIRRITLLDMASNPDCPSPETAQLLLECGANPNDQSGYKPLPIWEHILHRAQAAAKTNVNIEKWLQILDIFINYDVDLRGNSSDRKEAYKRNLDTLEGFRDKYPVHVMSLQKIIDKKLHSTRTKIKVWAGGKLGSRLGSRKTGPHPIRPLG